MIISLSPILYIIEVVQLVVVSLTRQADPQVSQDAVPLNDSTNHHSAQEAEESEEEGEDPGPEAAAAGVAAGVTLAALQNPYVMSLTRGWSSITSSYSRYSHA